MSFVTFKNSFQDKILDDFEILWETPQCKYQEVKISHILPAVYVQVYIDRPFSILCMFTQLKTTWLSTDPLIPGMQPQFKHNMYFKGVAVVSEAIKSWKPLRAFCLVLRHSFLQLFVLKQLQNFRENILRKIIMVLLFWCQVCICQHLCRTHSHCYTSCRHTFSALCHSLSRLM